MLILATTVATAATAATDRGDAVGVVALVTLVLLSYWVARSVVARRSARTCERFGHAPDPTTVGTWRERCARCGARLR